MSRREERDLRARLVGVLNRGLAPEQQPYARWAGVQWQVLDITPTQVTIHVLVGRRWGQVPEPRSLARALRNAVLRNTRRVLPVRRFMAVMEQLDGASPAQVVRLEFAQVFGLAWVETGGSLLAPGASVALRRAVAPMWRALVATTGARRARAPPRHRGG